MADAWEQVARDSQRELSEVREAWRAFKLDILRALGITEPWAVTTWNQRAIAERIEQRMKLLAAVERVMEASHRDINIAWTEMGQKWDGQTSIQFARAIMVHRVLNGETIPLPANKSTAFVTLPHGEGK